MQRDLAYHSNITSYLLDDLPRHYQELLHTRSAASGRPSLRETFSEFLKHLDENLQSDHIGFALHNRARNVVSVILQAGEHEFPAEIPILESSLGLVLNQGQSIEVQDVETETKFGDLVNRARSGGFRSFRVVPLTTDRQTLGCLLLVRRRGAASAN